MKFETNVFINCPFDPEFKPLLHPLLFTIIYHKLKPRIATETLDSSEQRITKIIELIKDSKYSIHDLSRVRASEIGQMFRLNMPYELGIDVGCRTFGGDPLNKKRHLIIAAEKYAYKMALSDIAGSDIRSHNNEPKEVVRVVRQWIENEIGSDVGVTAIFSAYEDFNAKLYDAMEAQGHDQEDIENIQIGELIKRMEEFIPQHKLRKEIQDSKVKTNDVHQRRLGGIDTTPFTIQLALPSRTTQQAKKDAELKSAELKARKLAAGASVRAR